MSVRVWRMRTDFWALRFYLFCWSANPERINFCKFFWGLVFSPLALLLIAGHRVLRILIAGAIFLGSLIPRPVLAAADWLPAFFIRAIFAFLIWLLVAAATALALVNPAGFWQVVLVIFAFAGGVAFLGGLIFLIAEFGPALKRQHLLLVLASLFDRALRLLFGVVAWPIRIAAHGVAAAGHSRPSQQLARTSVHTIAGASGILSALYHALKDQTCPQIEVIS